MDAKPDLACRFLPCPRTLRTARVHRRFLTFLAVSLAHHLTSPHLTHPLFLHCIHLYPPSCLHDRVYSIHLLLLNTDKSNRRNTPDAACLP